MVSDIEKSVGRLSGEQYETDGGGQSDVTIPDDLPEGMPDFVVDMLPEDQLRAVARGDIDPDELP